MKRKILMTYITELQDLLEEIQSVRDRLEDLYLKILERQIKAYQAYNQELKIDTRKGGDRDGKER
ncbi:MAG TPA: hypothetical protein PLK41_04500 [Defluviitoga tunisiensis]|nr:hypothetical protein [bacterium]HPP10231.1 hypothetical protein [Defluviitoga tunisiensis]